MTLRPANITLDCDQPLTVAAFWSAALESKINDGASEFFASISHGPSGMNFFFIKVPEPKAGKNRLHIDYEAPDPAAEIERLIGLGATTVAEKSEWGHEWTTLADPEGNEFCISVPHN